jgi:hypothetical protein
VDFCTIEYETTVSAKDFDGVFRPDDHPTLNNGGTVDLGAYEIDTNNFEEIVDVVPNFEVVPNPVSSGEALSFRVSVSNNGAHRALGVSFRLELDRDNVENAAGPLFDVAWGCVDSTTSEKVFFDCTYGFPLNPGDTSTVLTVTANAVGLENQRFFHSVRVDTSSFEMNPNNNTALRNVDIQGEVLFRNGFE